MEASSERARISAVIFDMDGLMFDTERLAVDAWIEAAGMLGHRVGRPAVLETLGMDEEQTEAVLRRALGDSFPFARARELRDRIAEDAVRTGGVPVKAGLRELLEFLSERRVTCAVCTSTERARADALIGASGVGRYFRVVVCGDEVARSKPDPEIFLKAALGLGCAPGRCAVLEDSRTGIAAAHAAGMIPIMIPDLVGPDATTRSRLFGEFTGLDGARAFFASGVDFVPAGQA